MLSEAWRVHPVIVGWSTPNRPLIPSPSMMIPLPHVRARTMRLEVPQADAAEA